MTRITMIGLSGLLLSGCIDIPGPVCANGLHCPSGQVCVGERCVPKDQVLACEDRDDEAPCDAAEFSGQCRASVCEPAVCGNGYLDAVNGQVELCDDGNLIPGDGCSTDCQTKCGDGILDLEREVCDIVPPNHQTCLTQGYDMGALVCDASCERADTDQCISFSWNSVSSMPSDWQLGAVWAFSAQDIYAVGGIGEIAIENLLCLDCGYLFHYDGASGLGWQKTQPVPGATMPLSSIWAAGPEDIFVAGVGDQMWHYDGTAWTRMATGLANPFNVLYDLWGTSTDNIFALYRGLDGVGDPQPGILHYDGMSWKPMEWTSAQQVNGLWGRSAEDVYLATSIGLYHYDGNAQMTWNEVDATHGLRGVWGNDNEIIAVGKYGRIIRQSADTGGTWAPMDSGVDTELFRLWGDDDSNFFAVGRDSTVLRKSANTDEWTAMSAGVDAQVLDVFGLGPVDVFAVGSDGTALHCCGWEELKTPSLPQYTFVLEVVDDACVYVAGHGGVIARHDLDGPASFEPEVTGASISPNDLWGASCDAGVFAVGYNGVILRYDGVTWSPMDSNTTAQLRGVWGSDADNVFAVGHGGTVVHWNGVVWQALDVPAEIATLDLLDVWGADANMLFFVGRQSSLVRYERDPVSGHEDWTLMRSRDGVFLPLYSVWGVDECNVWAAGQRVMHYRCGENGGPDVLEVVDLSNEPLENLRKVWGSAWNDIFVGGEAGTLMHFDGSNWSQVRSPSIRLFPRMTGTSDGRSLFAMDTKENIYRLNREELP